MNGLLAKLRGLRYLPRDLFAGQKRLLDALEAARHEANRDRARLADALDLVQRTLGAVPVNSELVRARSAEDMRLLLEETGRLLENAELLSVKLDRAQHTLERVADLDVGRRLLRQATAPADGATPLATNASRAPEDKILFMHVPKTAGTALVAAMTREFPAERVAGGVFDHCTFGGFLDFATLAPAQLRNVHPRPADLPRDADFICGHVAFSTLRAAYPGGQLMTVLREPVSRLLSLWLFWRQHKDLDLAHWGSWAERVKLSRLRLADFLSRPDVACQTDNAALRMLLWPHPRIPLDGFIDPRDDAELLQLAMAALGSFAFLDVVENPRLAERLGAWLGLAVPLERINETRGNAFAGEPLPHALHGAASQLLADRTRLDQHLWRAIAQAVIRGQDIDSVRIAALLANLGRFASIMELVSA